MTPRTGRPPIAEPRTQVIRYRVTEAELSLLREAAGEGAESVWARDQALAAARREVKRRSRS